MSVYSIKFFMIIRFFAVASLLLGLLGCYRLPRQSGTWEGVAQEITLFKTNRAECVCVALKIASGPQRKVFVPERLVIVDRQLQVSDRFELVGKRLRIRGRVESVFPRCTSGM